MRFCLLLITVPLLAQEILPLRPVTKTEAAEKWEERGKDGVKDRAVSNVTQPDITVYLPPKGKATGTAILIAPGGGYAHLAIDKEGHDIARWLTSIGVVGIVLKYRLPGRENMRPSLGDFEQAKSAAWVAIEDAGDAMRLVRKHAAHWNVKPGAVGMMGFSAGGHLAAMMGMLGEGETKPDFLVLAYPAIPKGLQVTEQTPRTFMVHADDDGLSAADNSVHFYLALKKAKVRSELHVYSGGGHGFGMKKTDKTSTNWPQALEAWLKTTFPTP